PPASAPPFAPERTDLAGSPRPPCSDPGQNFSRPLRISLRATVSTGRSSLFLHKNQSFQALADRKASRGITGQTRDACPVSCLGFIPIQVFGKDRLRETNLDPGAKADNEFQSF